MASPTSADSPDAAPSSASAENGGWLSDSAQKIRDYPVTTLLLGFGLGILLSRVLQR
jgi:hypothetical protein